MSSASTTYAVTQAVTTAVIANTSVQATNMIVSGGKVKFDIDSLASSALSAGVGSMASSYIGSVDALNSNVINSNYLDITYGDIANTLSSSAIQSGIYGTEFKDALLANISASTGDYLFKQAGNIGLVKDLDDGSLSKTLIHSVVGGTISSIGGDSFIDGALIAGSRELLSPLSKDLGEKEQILSSQLIGILSGAIINDETGANQGYSLATSAEVYNRQLHQDEERFLKERSEEFRKYYKDITDKELSSQEARDLLLLSGRYIVNAKDNGIINIQNDPIINLFNIFGKAEFNKDEINTAMGFIFEKSQGMKFIDIYSKPFTNKAREQEFFTATDWQFYNNSYDPSSEFFESDTFATKLFSAKYPLAYMHYSRNRYNKVADIELKNISNTLSNSNISNIEQPTKLLDNWVIYPKDKSIYHQIGENNKDNIKLVNNDGRELVLKYNYGSYNIVDDNLNIGTYNYSNPDGGLSTVGHIVYDVLPYYIYGNTPYDSIKYIDRGAVTIEL
ncbi:MAG: hypothetical protein GX282_06245 [Campylobacteraceae bacterium]|nr:hypothetical protein [Campylobacteraceae bacterium]